MARGKARSWDDYPLIRTVSVPYGGAGHTDMYEIRLVGKEYYWVALDRSESGGPYDDPTARSACYLDDIARSHARTALRWRPA